MLGYSSVMHMGYIFLGITSLNIIGLSGAAMMMFAHGLSIAILFAAAGEVRARTGTMRLDELGGLARSMPFLTLIFGLGMFASIGLPGFANFASELLVFFGSFANGGSSLHKLNYHQVAAVCGLWGVVMSAVYMLRAFRRVFLGPPKTALAHSSAEDAAAPIGLSDLVGGQRWALALLMAGLVVVGFRPGVLLNLVRPALQQASGQDVESVQQPAPGHEAAFITPARPGLPPS